MEAKLKSLLKNPRSALLLKALTFGGLLILAKGWALPAAVFLYAKPIFNTFAFLTSFLILMFLSAGFINLAPGGWFFALAAIGLSFIFYLILGLKNLVFIYRDRWNYVLHIFLFYATFVLFFLSDKSDLFFLKSLGVFAAAILLFREFLKNAAKSDTAASRLYAAENFPKRRMLVSWTLALIVWEAIWVISLLPIGFLNSANLAIVLVFLLSDLSVNHFKGTSSRRWALFVFMALLILAASRWSLSS